MNYKKSIILSALSLGFSIGANAQGPQYSLNGLGRSIISDNGLSGASVDNDETIQKANPAIVIRTWNKYITAKYGDVIEQGNLQYFIEKDYSEDLQKLQNSSDIVKAIDMLRTPIKNMSDTNQKHTLEYLQKLCKLSAAYAAFA